MKSTYSSFESSRSYCLTKAPQRAAFACILALGMTSFGNAEEILRGNVGPRIIDDNVAIARNSSCTLNGTVIKGNVRVLGGARLTAFGAKVDGNVQAFGSKLVELKQRTEVKGDVQGEETRTLVVRGSTVGGNIQLKEGAAIGSAATLLVQNTTIGGDLQAEKSTGRLNAFGNRIDGNLQFVENKRGPYAIKTNRIKGDLQFFKNRGSAIIVRNRVGGNLQSKENGPRPAVRKNLVEGDTELE